MREKGGRGCKRGCVEDGYGEHRERVPILLGLGFTVV